MSLALAHMIVDINLDIDDLERELRYMVQKSLTDTTDYHHKNILLNKKRAMLYTLQNVAVPALNKIDPENCGTHTFMRG